MSLDIRNVTKKFDNIRALNDISLEIQKGEFIAILGPSGCGKTTLLGIIGGVLAPTSGSVTMDDQLYANAHSSLPVEKRNLGMVFQSFALWPHMTVREHIMYPLNSKHGKVMSKKEKEKAVGGAMASTGLIPMEHRLPEELSGGQRQRVALARAIVSKPDLLLMDEPLSALDAELRVNMRKEIQDIHKLSGATIIYVTHDQSEALAMADRIVIMNGGRIEQIGTPREIYENPRTAFVATFVSKCNLVKGRWVKDKFIVHGSNITYTANRIDDYFIENGLFPVRPDQWQLAREGAGITGIIRNKQYSGREVHYTVQNNNDFYTVYEQPFADFQVEESVILKRRGKVN